MSEQFQSFHWNFVFNYLMMWHRTFTRWRMYHLTDPLHCAAPESTRRTLVHIFYFVSLLKLHCCVFLRFRGVVILTLRLLQKWSRCYQIIKFWRSALVGNRHSMQYFWKHFSSTQTQYQSKSGTFKKNFFTSTLCDCLFWTMSCFVKSIFSLGAWDFFVSLLGFQISVIGAIMVVVKTVLW